MQGISRKRFLTSVAKASVVGAIYPSAALAKGVGQSFDGGQDYSALLSKRFDWFCDHFFDFRKPFSIWEQQYVHQCFSLMDEWAYGVDDKVSLSTVSYSHRIKENSINSSRLAVGSIKYRHELAGLHRRILQLNGVDPSKVKDFSHLFGLGWDFLQKEFKLYFYYADRKACQLLQVNRLVPVLPSHAVHPFSLASLTYRDYRPFEYKVYLYPQKVVTPYSRDLPFESSIKHTTHMIGSRRGTVAQMDLDKKTDVNQYLDRVGVQLVDQFATINWHLDTIAYQGSKQYTLYF